MSLAEDRPEVYSQRRGLVVELAPRDSDHSSSLGLQCAIALTVALEGGPGPVRRLAIELDDDALALPQAVAFDPFAANAHRCVYSRSRYRA